MYLGLKDTPFQRYFKEHYGDKYEAPKENNAKKQHAIGQTIGFNTYSNKKDVYKDLDTKGRRAKEFDSCLWAENEGNYKAFDNKDIKQNKHSDISSCTNWKSKEAARFHDNKERNIDIKEVTQENLSSSVLPMEKYENSPQKTQDEGGSHGIDSRRKTYERKGPKSRQRMMVSNSNWNNSNTEGLSNFGGFEKNNFINLLNQSQNYRDPKSHHLKKNFNGANINLSSLKRQENLAGHLGEEHHYENMINQKLEGSSNNTGNEVVSSQNFTAKELKQKFLEGQEDRYLFNAEKSTAQNKTDVGIHTLDLDNIPQNLNQDDLKRALGVNHLVSLEVETNNVKNISTGKGKIIFRSNTEHEKEKIESNIKALGINAKDYQLKNKEKAPRVASSQIGILDSRNEIDLMKGKRDFPLEKSQIRTQPKIKNSKKITGKVGENLFIKPKDYLKDSLSYSTNCKSKRTEFYKSCGDLLGNTNGNYAKKHSERINIDRQEIDKSTKEHQVHNKLAHGKLKI